MNKQHTTLSIESELLEESKKRNINMSEVLHWALLTRISDIENVKEGGAFPFEFCKRRIPEHLRETTFGCAGIRARRCTKCGKVWFVNDLNNEFKICKECWEIEGNSSNVETNTE